MTLINTQVNRRSFIKVSAAAGGGMLIGFSWLTQCTPAGKPMVEVPKEWFEMNGYIKIGDTGMVTIYSPNPEIGQNVRTSMPMIVAEELDVDWANVVVEQAPLNTGFYQNQFSGGSLSIRLSWDALRMAGATARRMLLEAAAKEWGVSADDLIAELGVIREKDGRRKVEYGAIAAKAVDITVPEQVELKAPKDYKLIGTPVKNVDGRKIVTGQPLFGLDFQREGMLLAMIQHPPAFGMRVVDFNEAEIKAMDGVKDAFIINATIPEPGWSDVNAFPELIAIVGTSTWQLMKAKKAIRANWEAVGELESTSQHYERMDAAVQGSAVKESRQDGNPDEAFSKATKVLERTYTAPFIAHNTMEPMNFFAHVTADGAELIGPIQTPEPLEQAVSKVLGMDKEKITVQMTRIGGGFGRRLYVHFGVEAALISQKAGAPIKMIYTREDDMTQGTYRPAYQLTYKAGLDENNQMIAFSVKGAGIRESSVFPNRFPAGTVDHYLAQQMEVASTISTGAWRAPRSHFTAGAEQAFLDEVAELAGKDPIDFRLELFDRAINNPVGEKNDYDAARYAGVLKLVKEKSGWGQSVPGVHRGVAAYFCHSTYVAEVFDIVMENGQPVVQKVWCAVDCGIVVNPEGAKNQIEGGVIDGVGHALYSQMTFENGVPNQDNFHQYQLIRNSQVPKEIAVFFVENEIAPTGLGEPGLPPAIGALANALYQATARRYYDQPFTKNGFKLG